jgi:hypothetical protein
MCLLIQGKNSSCFHFDVRGNFLCLHPLMGAVNEDGW